MAIRITPNPVRNSGLIRIRETNYIIIININNNPISNFTYIRINARAFPNSKLIKIYINPSTGRSLIKKEFFKILEYTVEKKHAKIKGVGNKSIYIT